MPARSSEPRQKRQINLSLAPDRVAFGRQYAEAQQVSLSQVVSDLLAALEQAVAAGGNPAGPDPLEGMLADWPSMDKRDLRRAQQKARTAR